MKRNLGNQYIQQKQKTNYNKTLKSLTNQG